MKRIMKVKGGRASPHSTKFFTSPQLLSSLLQMQSHNSLSLFPLVVVLVVCVCGGGNIENNWWTVKGKGRVIYAQIMKWEAEVTLDFCGCQTHFYS